MQHFRAFMHRNLASHKNSPYNSFIECRFNGDAMSSWLGPRPPAMFSAMWLVHQLPGLAQSY